ncbi:hypothetical protein B0H10DRAFT_2116830 [Mycena sp. CBHHK59/15]|nr:hypothetical protein B0H10DRAFT_2116830 [Mycena sp. CBHHK59/15]
MSSPVERSARPQQFRGGSLLPSVPKETDSYIAAQWPQATEEERKKIFHNTVASFGAQRGFTPAVECFKTAHHDLLLGVTPLGPDRPLTNAVLREARVGDSPLAVFYHSTYPPALQHAAPLMWTFYIGFRGRGEGSIMLEAERATRGICLFALNMEEEWQEFTLFQVPASTRVRIEYAPDLTSTSPKRRSVELVFPAVPPTQGPIPVQQLL